MTFRQIVYEIVSRIPEGSIMTYASVARAAGKPGAARAVGTALHKNTDFGRVPCHRVVRSDGAAGGYAKGNARKIALLKKEGIEIMNNKIDISRYE